MIGIVPHEAALTAQRRTYVGGRQRFAFTRDECVPCGLPSQSRDGAKLAMDGMVVGC
jgi:hypothetical protein